MPLLFAIISILSLFFSAYLYRIASGENVWKLNMLTYSFIIIFLVGYMSTVIILLDLPLLGYNPKDDLMKFGDKTRQTIVWAIVMWAMIGIPLGGILINSLLNHSRVSQKMKIYRSSIFSLEMGISDELFFWVICLSVLITGYYNFIYRPEINTIRAISQGSSVIEGQIIRRSATQGSGNLVFDLLMNIGTLTLLSLVAFAKLLNTKLLKWRILFICSFLLLSYLSLLVGNVTTIVMYLVVLGFVRYLVKGVFIRLYEGFLFLIMITMLFSFLKGYGDSSILEVLSKFVLTRVVFSQIYGTYFAFEVFPLKHDFLFFSSTARELHSLLGLRFEESYGIIMMQFHNPEGVEAGSAGHLTTIFMGEAWANFGIFGIIAAPLWVGGILQLLNQWFVRQNKNSINIAFYAYLTISFGYASDFIGFYYPLGTLMLVIGFFTLIWLIKVVIVHKKTTPIKFTKF